MHDLLARVHATLGAVPRTGVQALFPAARPSTHRIEATTAEATVWVYDAIGDFGVSAAELVPAIEALTAPAITVRVNSPGGDYFAGVAIANALARHPASVTVHVDALAASAASVIAMAGDDVVMHPGARMMIHDALTMTMGNAAEHEKTAALLDGASQDIAAVYAARSGTPTVDHWRGLMKAETWFGADEAVTAGLASRLAEPVTSEPTVLSETPQWLTLLRAFHSTVDTLTTSAALPTAEAAPSDASSPAPVNLSDALVSALT